MTTSPFERYLTYAVLALFSADGARAAVGVVLAALHPSGELLSGLSLPSSFSLHTFRVAWDEGDFESLMRRA